MKCEAVDATDKNRMRRYAVLLIALAFAVAAVACSDAPAPSSKGNRAVGVEVQEAAEAREAGEVEKGVVPDLIGVAVGDAKAAVVEAGFKTGNVDTVGLFGTVGNDWLVCETDPAAGASPKRGSEVALIADRVC
jgi:hypothetical protein